MIQKFHKSYNEPHTDTQKKRLAILNPVKFYTCKKLIEHHESKRYDFSYA